MKLSIPTPCQEDWNNMTAQQQGRFCQTCAKTVIDFTKMTDREIVDYLQHATGRTCGKLNQKQLNRELAKPVVFPLRHSIRTGAVAATLLAGTAAGFAQTQPVAKHPTPLVAPPPVQEVEVLMGDIMLPNPSTEEREKASTTQDSLQQLAVIRAQVPVPSPHNERVNRVGIIFPPKLSNDSFTISGIVRDESGEPLIGATVMAFDADQYIELGVMTTNEGKFSMIVPSGAVHIRVSYLGHMEEIVSLSAGQTEQLEITLEETFLLGDIGIVAIERPWYQRMFGWQGGHRVRSSTHYIRDGITNLWSSLTENAKGAEEIDNTSHTALKNRSDNSTPANTVGGISLFPNPSNGTVTMSFHALEELANLVNVYTGNGQLVLAKAVMPQQSSIDVALPSDVASGTYFIELLSDTGQVLAVKQWLVQR